MTTQQLLDVREVAEILGLKPQQVYRMSRLGQMPSPIRIGRRLVRWRRTDLESWLDQKQPVMQEAKNR